MNIIRELVAKYKDQDIETFYEEMLELKGAMKALSTRAQSRFEKETVEVTLAFIELAITMAKDLIKCKQTEKEEQ